MIQPILRLLELMLLFTVCLFRSQNAVAQMSPCRTSYLDLSTGKDYENNTVYPAGSSDPYWRVSNGPANAGVYPQCAFSSGVSYGSVFGNTRAIQFNSAGITHGNMPFAINACNYNDQPYLFERDFMVNTGMGNPTINATLNIEQLTADYSVSSIVLSGPGGPFILVPSCLGPGLWSLPSTTLPLQTGLYTLQVHVANEWALNASPTIMRMQLKAFIYANQNLFVDNKHFGKSALCAPNYVVLQTPVLANTCVDASSTSTDVVIDNYQMGMTYTIQPPVTTTSLFTFTGHLGTTYTVTATDNYGCSLSATAIVDTCMVSEATIKLCIQGYMLPNGKMTPVCLNQGLSSDSLLVDSLMVEWTWPEKPDSVIASGWGLLNTDGYVTVQFNPIPSGYYHLTVRYANALAIRSAMPLPLISGVVYDVSEALSSVFAGQLLDMGNNRLALKSGDLNQDGAIDAFDYIEWLMGSNNGLLGNRQSDLNGDGAIDSLDYLLLEVQVQIGATSACP